MVRKRGIVWQYFVETRIGNYKGASCKFCKNKKLAANASRMTSHLVNCLQVPENVKKIFMNASDSKASNNVACVVNRNLPSPSTSKSSPLVTKPNESGFTSNNTESFASSSIQSESVAVSSVGNINRFMDKMTAKENENLNKMLAKAMYTSNCPLSLLENEWWKEFFMRLRPSFSVPSRYQLSNKYLDEEFETIKEQITRQIQSSDAVSLLSDGWTDINGVSLINIVFTTPHPIFYKSIDSQTERHTGQYIASVLSKAIDEVGPNKVRAVITDNAANMQLAWKLLKQKYPHIITYGCQAHGLNLLIRDIIQLPTINNVLKKSSKLVKFFNNKHLPKQWLRKTQIEKHGKPIALLKAVDTRWGSHLASLESVLKNKECFQTLGVTAEFKEHLKPQILKIILYDRKFWHNVENTINLLKGPATVLKNIEGNNPSALSYMYTNLETIYVGIVTHCSYLPKQEREQLTEIYEKRRKFMFHTVQLAAHFLNPKLKHNSPLAENDETIAKTFVIKYAELIELDHNKILKDIGEYCAKTALWDDSNIWDAAMFTDPVTWWKGYCSQRELHKVAIIILNFPASSAACERNWSEYANVKTKKRNRLTVDRTNKLISVCHNLKLFKAMEKSKNRNYNIENEETEEIILEVLTDEENFENEDDGNYNNNSEDDEDKMTDSDECGSSSDSDDARKTDTTGSEDDSDT